MAIPERLDALLRAHGPSGHEQLAAPAVRAAVADVAEVESDHAGNIVARRRSEGPLIAIVAHLDTIGLAVSHVADDGLVSVHRLGTWRASVAFGQRVAIETAEGTVPGVLARRVKDDEKVEWKELYVDIGARDGEEARRLVAPGDPLVLDAPPLELANGRIASRGLDNRAGVWAALEALRRLDGLNVAAVCAAQEELGYLGARIAAHRLRPDVAVVVDVTYATDVGPDDPRTGGDHRLGAGVAIYRGPAVNPRVFEALVAAAEEEGIAYTVETGARSFTDTEATFGSRDGIPAGLVSIPLRNMHSGIELADPADLEACAGLLAAFARRVRPDASYAR